MTPLNSASGNNALTAATSPAPTATALTLGTRDDCGLLPSTNWQDAPGLMNCLGRSNWEFDPWFKANCSNEPKENVCPDSPCDTYLLCDPNDCSNGRTPWWEGAPTWECGWTESPMQLRGASRLEHPAKHYGVVGVPTSAAPSVAISALESWITTNILTPGRLPAANLGEPFTILPDGFVTQQTEGALWTGYLSPWLRDAAADGSKRTELDREALWYYAPPKENNDCGCEHQRMRYINGVDGGPSSCVTPIEPIKPGGPVWHPVANWVTPPTLVTGMCNSLIPPIVYRSPQYVAPASGPVPFGYYPANEVDSWHKIESDEDAANFPNACSASFKYATAPWYTLGWDTTIPIIADPSNTAAPCTGIDGATRDPSINPSLQYEIIGFVRVQIQDADIGRSPPLRPRLPSPGSCNGDSDYAAQIAAIPDSQWGFTVPSFNCPAEGEARA